MASRALQLAALLCHAAAIAPPETKNVDYPSLLRGLGHPLMVEADYLHEKFESESSGFAARLMAHAQSVPVMVVILALVIAIPFAFFYAFTKWQGQVRNVIGGLGTAEGMGVSAIVSLLIYVTLLISTDTLISYTAQSGKGKYPWNPVMLVCIVESAKFFVSLAITSFRQFVSPEASMLEGAEENKEPFYMLAGAAALRLFPVALIYAGNNCLVYVVLAYIQLDSYVVWRNTTILWNAILWTAILNRKLWDHQWVAVGFLMTGCCLNSMETDGSMRSIIGLPVLIVLISAFCSALAAVLNEGALKNDRFKRLGIDGLNCLLYSQTMLMLLTWLLGSAAYHGRSVLGEIPSLLSHLNGSALMIMSMQCTLGLAVSRVLKYANTVAKTMAGSAREVIQVGIAPLFVASRLDWISMLSVLWIATAMLTYAAPGPTLPPALKEKTVA